MTSPPWDGTSWCGGNLKATFRLDEGTLSWFGHRWDYETWTRETWRIWSRWHAEENEHSPEWGGEG